MTGVLPFLLFSLSSQSFTHMDAHSSQSFTSTSQGRRDEYGEYEIIEYDGYRIKYYTSGTVHSMPEDTPVYPEPEGEPSY